MQRSISKTVFIDAPPDVVWQALTNPIELSRWFSATAQITPELGGTVSLTWGQGAEGSAPITIWEPSVHLQWSEGASPNLQTIDFHLELRTGCTVLRMVHDGFSEDPTWDADFGLANGAWSYFLQHLKWYLERHRGTARQLTAWRTTCAFARRDTFARLLGPECLSVSDTLARIEVGEVYKTTTAAGDEFSGLVVSLDRRTCQIGLTIAELKDGLLFMEVEPDPEGSTAAFWLSTYGLARDRLAQARKRCRTIYESALGIAGG